MLSFGLIWLTYLRARERRVAVEGLAIYVPAGRERAAALRLLCLDPAAARFELFTYSEEDFVDAHRPARPRQPGYAPGALPPPRAQPVWKRGSASPRCPASSALPDTMAAPACACAASSSPKSRGGELLFGLAERRPARRASRREIERLVEELDRARSPEAADRGHPLYRQSPEAWLESQARAQIETLDASLLCDPIYGQVPAFAGGERGILDLLAVDRAGRLAVVELKASADLHLPLQALDYWIRVKWHLDRGEFTAHGYFPGVAVAARAAAPAAGLAVAGIPSQHGDAY